MKVVAVSCPLRRPPGAPGSLRTATGRGPGGHGPGRHRTLAALCQDHEPGATVQAGTRCLPAHAVELLDEAGCTGCEPGRRTTCTGCEPGRHRSLPALSPLSRGSRCPLGCYERHSAGRGGWDRQVWLRPRVRRPGQTPDLPEPASWASRGSGRGGCGGRSMSSTRERERVKLLRRTEPVQRGGRCSFSAADAAEALQTRGRRGGGGRAGRAPGPLPWERGAALS